MNTDTTAFYDAVAEYYPLFYKDWSVQLEREGLSLRAIFRSKGIERVLVASCRAGSQAIPLAELGFKVVAVDASAGMLKKAQEIATEHGVLDDIEFERCDITELTDVVDGTFDAIVTKNNALPHLLTDDEIETTLLSFYELLRPGGVLVVGMRDFGPFMEARPRFLPGFDHKDDSGEEFITFDIWEWDNGPPVLATQNLYIVQGNGKTFDTIKRQVVYRPLSVDEVKVVMLEVGFEEPTEQPDRWEQILVTRKPLSG